MLLHPRTWVSSGTKDNGIMLRSHQPWDTRSNEALRAFGAQGGANTGPRGAPTPTTAKQQGHFNLHEQNGCAVHAQCVYGACRSLMAHQFTVRRWGYKGMCNGVRSQSFARDDAQGLAYEMHLLVRTRVVTQATHEHNGRCARRLKSLGGAEALHRPPLQRLAVPLHPLPHGARV